MKKLIFIIPFLLSGCLTTVPVARHFPDVPMELKTACPDLKQTDETTKLSEVIKVVSDNYVQYHDCQVKVDAWLEWYNTQKKIFEEVK